MYVCNCNGLRWRDVEEALSQGIDAAEDVYAHHGCRMRCGRCLPEIIDRMAQRCISEAMVA